MLEITPICLGAKQAWIDSRISTFPLLECGFRKSVFNVKQTTCDMKKIYQPDVQEVGDLLGLSMNAAMKGQQVKVLCKAFFTSYEDNHRHFFNQILNQFPGLDTQSLNQVLIVIRDKKAYIYKDPPLILKVKPKVDVQAGDAVYEEQILDIVEAQFQDSTSTLDIENGDKFVWLFRVDWSFGLYFDFSGHLTTDQLWIDLGRYYRTLRFYSLYSLLSTQDNFRYLFNLGWFPFIQILGGKYNQLMLGINDPKGIKITEEQVVLSFTDERIENFTKYWWQSEIFEGKKELITAALNAYKRGDSEGVISCIKTLTSEIEGIIRLDYHRSMGSDAKRHPKTRDLEQYMLDRGKENFSDTGSLGFPGLFVKYIGDVFFKGFDIAENDVDLSRHSVGHGVVSQEKYTRVRALQLILILDQIYFFLQHRQSTPEPD